MNIIEKYLTPKTDKILRFVVAPLVLVAVVGLVLVGLNGFSADTEAEAASLKMGSSGSTVRELQTRLKNWGYYTGSVDGIYGPKTRAAVIKFQQKNNLVADGIVGSKTAAALGMSLTSQTSSDLYLLAKCIYAEARGEPYAGQVAVGAVILNRVKSSSFPNTISGVIYQPYAFTAVADGQINLEPNDTAYNAARDALNGWDPSYGALYYYNPSTATSSWIWSRTVLVTIGKHKFAI